MRPIGVVTLSPLCSITYLITLPVVLLGSVIVNHLYPQLQKVEERAMKILRVD